jgi:DNA helicase IV
MLVVGEAGCGKTTVALHRVAALRKRAEREGRPFRALVLVPVEGLRRLSTSLLERYGAPDVDVRVFERWAAIQARRAFPGVPRRESDDSQPAIVRIKRHPGVRDAIDEIVARPRSRASATASREDLLYLFGDQDLLERVAARSNGAITPAMIRSVRQHTSVQFTDTTEQEYAHVEKERLETVDGRLIDAGTPMEDAGTIDVEDYAVLFALAARRAKRPDLAPAPTRYDCVVLDEAQEFAPLELELIGRSLVPGGTLTVAGDEGQQVDTTAYFGGWANTMHELGALSYERVHLEVSYRCPPSVTTVARAVLDANAERPIDAGLPPGGDVIAYRAPTECHLVARIVDGLRDLRVRDPNALAAVICRTPEAATRLARLLARGIEVHLAHDGDFRFVPGVEVTCVQEVKGLEFDHVVVPDTGGASYPDDGESRRALYVAATRASEQLVLATVRAWSALMSAR